MDVMDLFGEEPETYRASLWLYNSTKGVVALGGLFSSPEAAQSALRAYSQLPDLFFDPIVNGGSRSYANKAWKNRWNRAVVTRENGGDVVHEAVIPEGWFPPGDPRREENRG